MLLSMMMFERIYMVVCLFLGCCYEYVEFLCFGMRYTDVVILLFSGMTSVDVLLVYCFNLSHCVL